MTINEMFEKLWWAYPNDLCKGKKGGKQPALKALQKINPDEKEFKRIMLNLEAMKTADRKDKDAYRWPFVSSWLNQARYDDAMPEMHREDHQISDLKVCSIENCQNQAHGSAYIYCCDHIPSKWDNRLRQAWRETGLNRNSPTLVQDCKDYIVKMGYGTFIR